MHIFSRQGPQLNTLKRQWPSYLPAFSPQTRVPELWTSPLATVHQLPAEGAQWGRLIVPLLLSGLQKDELRAISQLRDLVPKIQLSTDDCHDQFKVF